MNSILARLPLAGLDAREYRPNPLGDTLKMAKIASVIAVAVLGALAIAHVGSPTALSISAISLSLAGIGFHMFGSTRKMHGSAFAYDLAVATVCSALALLYFGQMISLTQMGIGLVGAMGGSVLLANFFEKNRVEELTSPDVAEKRKQPWVLTCLDMGIGLSKAMAFGLHNVLTSTTHYQNYTKQPEDDAEALCVLVHGLGGHPSAFDEYHDALSQMEKKVTILQPHVHNKGNCSLDEAAEEIQKSIQIWANSHPRAPIIFVGGSNGARIVGHISSTLKKDCGLLNPMQVFALAGPFNGTEFVNRPSWPNGLREFNKRLATKMKCQQVVDELSFGSKKAHAMTDKMREAAQDGVQFFFYATGGDHMIIPHTSGFPKVEKGRYFVVEASGHSSLVWAAKDHILSQIDVSGGSDSQ